MICFRDQTYCPFWSTCISWKECHRAMTPDVIDAADKFGLPICQFMERPKCFKSVEDKDAEVL